MWDLHAGDRLFFFTTTGWMMWNFLVSVPMADVVPVMYDGNPAWPDPDILWKMVEDTGTAMFGASPTYQAILAKAGLQPGRKFDLSKLESIMLAGSPVTAECGAWFYENVKKDLWVAPGSGGTDVCSGFVGGVVTEPFRAGEITRPCLGVAAAAFNERGEKVVNEVGELVITEPMPSMPVFFWNDADGKRYFDSYFAEYPGVWRHGDFFKMNEHRACFVLGRSDATLNRHRGDLPLAREPAGGGRLADRQSRPAGREVLHAAVRETAGRPGVGRGDYRTDSRHAPARVFSAARPG